MKAKRFREERIRVIRGVKQICGSSWLFVDRGARCTVRYRHTSGNQYRNVGFRCSILCKNKKGARPAIGAAASVFVVVFPTS